MDARRRPRSIAEIEFAARMFQCAGCGDWHSREVSTGGTGSVWIVTATCSRCRHVSRFEFATDEDLFAIEHPAFELGNAEPSEIIEPFDLMREIDQLTPMVQRSEQLRGRGWTANVQVVERIRIALRELAKFVSATSHGIPIEAHRSADGAQDHEARSERYTQEWIQEETARWDWAAEEIAEDASRIFAADPVLARATPPRGVLDPDAIADHAGWLARGRSGRGRLDVVTWNGDELVLEGARLTASRLQGVRIRRGVVRSARLDDAELIDVDLEDAVLDAASFHGASLNDCSLVGVSAVAAFFERTVIREGAFDRATLDYSQWTAADVQDCCFRGASLRRTRLAAVRFTRCDFRGATFEGSDLKDAVMAQCMFDGASGVPSVVEGLRVENANLGDGRHDGDTKALLEELAARGE